MRPAYRPYYYPEEMNCGMGNVDGHFLPRSWGQIKSVEMERVIHWWVTMRSC